MRIYYTNQFHACQNPTLPAEITPAIKPTIKHRENITALISDILLIIRLVLGAKAGSYRRIKTKGYFCENAPMTA